MWLTLSVRLLIVERNPARRKLVAVPDPAKWDADVSQWDGI